MSAWAIDGRSSESSEREREQYPRFPWGRLPSIGPAAVVNPFDNPHVIGPRQALIMLLTIPAFVIRSILMLLALAFGHFWVKLALLGVKDPLLRPFSPWRRALLWPVRLTVRFIMFLLGYYWIPVKGRCAPREVSPIIVSNHISFVEPLYIFYAHLPIIVSAKENLSLPLVGSLLQALQIISVDRTSPTSKHDVAIQIKRRAIDNCWPHVAIFPEGTTTNGSALISFKTGAFSPCLPVQPMVISYKNLNPAWVDESPFLILFFLMTQPANFMEVEYLPVVIPTKNELKDPHLYAERVRRIMAQALNLPWTDHTFLDAKLATIAAKLHQPKGLSLIEFARMEKLFHLDFETAKEYLEKFSAMDTTHSGLLRVDQFISALGLPWTPLTQEVFHLFDKSDKGFINFQEFVAGLAFLSKHTAFSETVAAAFHACDKDGDGKLSQTELKKSLMTAFPDIPISQTQKIFDSLDLDHDGVISWGEFSSFLGRNPEYLAVIMTAYPELLKDKRI